MTVPLDAIPTVPVVGRYRPVVVSPANVIEGADAEPDACAAITPEATTVVNDPVDGVVEPIGTLSKVEQDNELDTAIIRHVEACAVAGVRTVA